MFKIKSNQNSHISLSKTQLKSKNIRMRAINSKVWQLFYTNLENIQEKRNPIISSAAQAVPFTD